MKRLYVLGSVFIAAATLAACGGGGSSPSPLPSTPPTTNYSLSIKFTGGNSALQAVLMRPMVSTMAANTNQNVLLTSPNLDASQWNGSWISGASYNPGAGTVTVTVSPQPTSSPSPATWALQNPHASFTPGANQTSAVGNSVAVNTYGVQQASSGTTTATVPGIGTATANVYVYNSLSVACTTSDPSIYGTSASDAQGGVAFVNGLPQATNDPASADIYIDGPNCFGKYSNPSESEITVHCPHGCVYESDPSTFLAVTASSFANPISQMGVNEMLSQSTAVASNVPGYLLLKDSAGDTIKLWMDVQNVTNIAMSGPYAIHGKAIDNF